MCKFKKYHKYGSPEPRKNQQKPFFSCWPNGKYKYFEKCNTECKYYYRSDEEKIISCNTCYWPEIDREKLYLCGQFIAETDKGNVWSFQGIFATKTEAEKACKNRNYFVVPVEVGQEIPKETSEWPGVEYPLIKRGETIADTTPRICGAPMRIICKSQKIC